MNLKAILEDLYRKYNMLIHNSDMIMNQNMISLKMVRNEDSHFPEPYILVFNEDDEKVGVINDIEGFVSETMIKCVYNEKEIKYVYTSFL